MTFPWDCFPQTHTGKSGGQVQGFSALLKAVLTIRSSREWKVIMHKRPPGANRAIISSNAPRSTSSSWLHSMRMAWNVLLEGWPFCRIFAGMAALITSLNSPVVSMGCRSLACTICFAIFLAKISSP